MRRAITDLDRVALQREARMGFGLHAELPTLLVSGGSQGSLQINTAVAGAWPELLAMHRLPEPERRSYPPEPACTRLPGGPAGYRSCLDHV